MPDFPNKPTQFQPGNQGRTSTTNGILSTEGGCLSAQRKQVLALAREAIRESAPALVEKLLAIALNEDENGDDNGVDPKLQAEACMYLLDRALGKAKESMDLTVDARITPSRRAELFAKAGIQHMLPVPREIIDQPPNE